MGIENILKEKSTASALRYTLVDKYSDNIGRAIDKFLKRNSTLKKSKGIHSWQSRAIKNPWSKLWVGV